MFSTPRPATLKPNKRGYTIMADAFTSTVLPSSAWGVRALSNPEMPAADKGGFSQPTTAMISREMTGLLSVHRGDVLFK